MNNSLVDGGEITLDTLVNKIFSEPVKPAKSIQLSFESNKTLKEVFETLDVSFLSQHGPFHQVMV